MSNWFHHDPAVGRAGPFSTDALLERYRNRLIQSDTLVWREGLREWQPLQAALAELEILLGPQDSSRPPPLPAHVPDPAPAAPRTMQATRPPHGGMAAGVPQKKGMSGCLIALIVVAVLAVPMFAVLAAIALPAYRDYTVRAGMQQALGQSEPAQQALVAFLEQHQACPADGDEGFSDAARFATPAISAVSFGETEDGACAYAMTLRSPAPLAGQTAVVLLEVADDQYHFAYDCSEGSLAAERAPILCRTAP
jgi:type IV pilus assembly protein PilA